MSLLAMCSYSTPENGKLAYLKQTLNSLAKTVNFDKHRLIIINNSQWDVVSKYLNEVGTIPFTLIEPGENLGTARGINLVLRERQHGEPFLKMDDDLTWHNAGWVDDMVRVLCEHPEIGILGLKRDDVYGELIEDGELLWNSDIMGTCVMFQPDMIERIGGLVQFSEKYGYDDTIYSVRSEAAGFRNAFMKNIRITNLDEGGTEYTEWKKREASVYLQEASIYMEMIKDCRISYYSEI